MSSRGRLATPADFPTRFGTGCTHDAKVWALCTAPFKDRFLSPPYDVTIRNCFIAVCRRSRNSIGEPERPPRRRSERCSPARRRCAQPARVLRQRRHQQRRRGRICAPTRPPTALSGRTRLCEPRAACLALSSLDLSCYSQGEALGGAISAHRTALYDTFLYDSCLIFLQASRSSSCWSRLSVD
jgi:hypothetical protein